MQGRLDVVQQGWVKSYSVEIRKKFAGVRRSYVWKKEKNKTSKSDKAASCEVELFPAWKNLHANKKGRLAQYYSPYMD